MEGQTDGSQALISRVHELHRVISTAQRELLSCLARLESSETWLDDGAHDVAHWISMQLGVSRWKAERWVSAGRTLRELPHTASSFASGELGIDKVVGLRRFATADDEEALVEWAQDVAPGTIRRRGDELRRSGRAEVEQIEEDRWPAWRWTDEGRRLLEAELPAAQGAVVTNAIDALASEIPVMPGEEGHLLIGRRRVDALAALCGSGGEAADDRSTVVVHVQAEALADAEASETTEDGAILHVASIRRLLCNAKIRAIVEAADGSVLGLGRTKREPSGWMMRQLRHRDRTCTFPGCGNRRFAHAHHICWWSRGGPTDLDNLALVCTFHHRLVHEYGWNLERAPDGEVRWFRPGGVRYRAGPLAA